MKCNEKIKKKKLYGENAKTINTRCMFALFP